MNVAHILIQHATYALDKTFTYQIEGFDVEQGSRVEVSFANQIVVGIVLKIDVLEEPHQYNMKPILRVIDEEPLLNEELFALGNWMAQRFISTRMACYQAMLPPFLKIKEQRKKAVMIPYVVYEQDEVFKTPKQQLAFEYIKAMKEVEKKSFVQEFKSVAKVIMASNAVRIEERMREASLEVVEHQPMQPLTHDQQLAFDAIDQNPGISLLHGVTGSGKTEVFLQLAQKELDAGKEVIILVPEIALTTQMIHRVKGRFGEHVAIYHSQLSAQEKLEQFQLVKQKKVQIIVGTRSCVFMPFTNLGLLIVDEEHDPSYKQENNPRYHTLDIVKQRAIYHQAKVLLASATPSLESYARALKGIYQLVELPNRINDQLPRIHIVNMHDEMRSGGEMGLSRLLLKKMEEAFERNEQVILLLNRRGYASQQRCLNCGHVATCLKCDIPFHYHQSDQSLHCHYCGEEKPLMHHCEKCNSTYFTFIGMGTQRLAERLQVYFPERKIIRMDYDTTRLKNAHRKLLESFERHEADLLIGTQMIAKGLDFPNVTLVGILNADDQLQMPTYQASFKTFTLICQAAGRSGRSEKPGEVIVQAFNPHHYSIIDACSGRYYDFFKKEMNYRHLAGYPPYYYLLSIILSSKDEEMVRTRMKATNEQIKESNMLKKIGPSALGKRNDWFRYRILLKSKDEQVLIQLGHEIMKALSKESKIRVEININPVDVE